MDSCRYQLIYRHYLRKKRRYIAIQTLCHNQKSFRYHFISTVFPSSATIIIHNRNPRPLIHIAPTTPAPLPSIIDIDPGPAPLPPAMPPSAAKAALTARRLHIPVVLVLRPPFGAVCSLAPDLALAVHVLGAIGRRGARAVARARTDLDVLRRPVVAAWWWRRGHVDGRRRGLYENRDGLWRRDGERSGLRRRHRDVGC